MLKITKAIHKKDKYYMELAEKVAEGSGCFRAKYGSYIISADGEPVGSGYNGKPRGACNDGICYRQNLPQNSPKENCCIHSEVNAVMFSSPERRKGGTIYVSGVPCNDCAIVLMQSGLKRIVWQDKATKEGHKGSSDISYWKKYNCDIELSQYDEATWQEFNKEESENVIEE